MNLDQRVKAVEQDLDILKAQIQTVLLEIQEYILNNSHPNLRANETPGRAARSVTGDQRRVEPELEPVLQAEPSHKTEPSQNHRSVENHNGHSNGLKEPPARQNGYANHRSVAPEKLAPEPDDWHDEPVEYEEPRSPRRSPAPQQSAERRVRATDLDAWIDLEKWVGQKVREVGIRRTRELVNLYPGEERDLLLLFLNVYEDAADRYYYPEPAPTAYESYPARPKSVQQLTAFAEQWQRRAKASPAQNGNGNGYRPFGDHQELVLRLIADMLSSGDEMPGSNGNGNGARH
ncbi:MAG: hypothetical protein IPK19_01185 [Chloroflexi bacterium]|nr:hypothetical protein [Chloroflexota bacterium]